MNLKLLNAFYSAVSVQVGPQANFDVEDQPMTLANDTFWEVEVNDKFMEYHMRGLEGSRNLISPQCIHQDNPKVIACLHVRGEAYHLLGPRSIVSTFKKKSDKIELGWQVTPANRVIDAHLLSRALYPTNPHCANLGELLTPSSALPDPQVTWFNPILWKMYGDVTFEMFDADGTRTQSHRFNNMSVLIPVRSPSGMLNGVWGY